METEQPEHIMEITEREEFNVQEYPQFDQFFTILKHFGSVPDEQMPFNEQLTRLSRLHEITEYKMHVSDPDNPDEDVLITMPLFKIEDIKLKSRRIIKMGDYYFTFNPSLLDNPQDSLLFYNKQENGKLIKAHHPHINDNGKPCLGEFQRQTGHLQTGNIIFIVKLARKFLSTHYYRSTFHNLKENYDNTLICQTHPDTPNPDETNQTPIPGERIEFRQMGWKLAHQRRYNHRTDNHDPLHLTGWQAPKMNGYIHTFMEKGLSFSSACRKIRSLIRNKEGYTETTDNEMVSVFANIRRQGHHLITAEGEQTLENGVLRLSDHQVRDRSFIRVKLTDTQIAIFQSWSDATQGNDDGQGFHGLPYVGELSEEELEHIMITGLWPLQYNNTEESKKDSLYKACLTTYELLEEQGQEALIKYLKAQLKKVEAPIGSESETTHTPRMDTAYTIPIADLPTF